jgi:hypothetical protein
VAKGCDELLGTTVPARLDGSRTNIVRAAHFIHKLLHPRWSMGPRARDAAVDSGLSEGQSILSGMKEAR